MVDIATSITPDYEMCSCVFTRIGSMRVKGFYVIPFGKFISYLKL